MGLFASAAETFTADVAFDSDDLSALATGDMTGRVLHSLSDLNGDGVADLVVFSLEGSKRSAYEVHFGTPTADGGTAFARDVAMAFTSDGSIQLGMDRHDFDRDGEVDLMFTTIEVEHLESSLWKRFKGFMGDDIWLGLEFYRLEGGRYPDTPNAIRRIALDGVPSHREPGWVPLDIVLRGATHERRRTQKHWPRAFNTTLRIGDVTGDGLADLLLGEDRGHLRRRTGTGPVRPATTRSCGRPAPRRGIHLAGGLEQGRQAGPLHAPPVHATRCPRGTETAAGNRAASGDDADCPLSKKIIKGITEKSYK